MTWVLASTLGVVLFAAAYRLSRENYLLFHAAIESFRSVVFFCIFVIAANSRGLLKSGNLWFLGVSCACTGVLSLLHMLAYKGMGVFPEEIPGGDADLATQLWTAGRIVESLALCVVAFTPHRRFPPGLTVAAVLGITAGLLVTIFVVPVFPDCYVEGVGLTPFKRISEFVTIGLFALAYFGLRATLEQRLARRRRLLQAAVVANMLGGLAFTLYADVYGVLNFLGHAGVAVADALVFATFIRSAIRRPQELMFWTLEQDRRALKDAVVRQNVQLLSVEAELEQGHAELEQTRQALDAVRAREQAVLEAVGEGILCVAQDGRVTFANIAATALLSGHGLAIGQPLPSMLRAVAPTASAGPDAPQAEMDLTIPGVADGPRATEPRILEIRAHTAAPPTGDASVLVIRDVTERRTFEREAIRHAEAMRQSLFETIAMVAQIITFRDPYTAGHQQRVAELAATLGREMGLPEDEVIGIHLAGSVHDIGKISIPSEILNRPGKLSVLEYEMLKTHSQVGYDIMKHADLPWPIADMIHQHHEKLDGTGYPCGLKGDAIIMGARILAVADIIEAMASHRPYRPALGVEVALAEVEKAAGVTLDAEVVAACLRLFRDKGYALSTDDWGHVKTPSAPPPAVWTPVQ